MYQELIFWNVVITLIALVFRYWKEILDRLDRILFSDPDREKVETELLCPNCASKDWTFPNPLKPGSNMVNLPNIVNQVYECKRCGYIGVFFCVAKKEAKSISRNKRTAKKHTAVNISRVGLYDLAALLITVPIVAVGFYLGGYLWGAGILAAYLMVYAEVRKKVYPTSKGLN